LSCPLPTSPQLERSPSLSVNNFRDVESSWIRQRKFPLWEPLLKPPYHVDMTYVPCRTYVLDGSASDRWRRVTNTSYSLPFYPCHGNGNMRAALGCLFLFHLAAPAERMSGESGDRQRQRKRSTHVTRPSQFNSALTRISTFHVGT
jgi:hypothetical protein